MIEQSKSPIENQKWQNSAECTGACGSGDSMKSGIRHEAIGDIKKKCFGFALCAMLFAFCCTAEAQQTQKIFRIGYLDLGTASGSSVLVDAFRQELSKLGWVEGENINFEY